MRYEVLKPFTYSHDGVETMALTAGMETEITDVSAPGLIEGGYIKEAKGKPKKDAPEPELMADSAVADEPRGVVHDDPVVTPAHVLQNPEIDESATLVNQAVKPRAGKTR